IVVSILARSVLASIIGVQEVAWAAAATLPSGCLWLMASVSRGALQGFQRYRAVGFSMIGEQVARLVAGLVLVAVGLGVTGAFYGTPLSLLAVVIALSVPLRRQLGPRHPSAFENRLRDLL